MADLCLVALAVAYLLVLAGVAVYDARRRLIPNAAVLALAVLGVAIGLAGPHASLAHGILPLTQTIPFALAVLLAGVLLELAWRALKGGSHGMGMGDIKLCAAAAVVQGPWVLPCLAVSCLLAAAFNLIVRNDRFAFAPWLCPVFAVCFLYRAFFA